MKRCSESEIMKANSPQEIFSSDLETIEKEKQEYLKTFYPKDYNKIRTYVVIKKMMLLYNEALVNIANRKGEEVEEIQSRLDVRTKSEKNYDIVNNVLESCEEMFQGFNQISNEEERKNKIDEYYMLLKEITICEDKLIEMGAIDKAYSEMNLKQTPGVQMSEADIKFIVACCEKEDLEKIERISKECMCNPMEILLSFFTETRILIKPIEFNTESGFLIEIPEIKTKWRQTEDMGYKKGYFMIGADAKSRTSDLCKGSWYYDYNSYGEKLQKVFRYLEYKKWEEMEKDFEREATTETRFDEKMAIKVIESKQKDAQKRGITPHPQYIYEFKSFLSYLNSNIALSNLRSIHSELKRMVRKYKLEGVRN